ncbi:hypothetical protein [Hymenobacter nivis]|uniref:Tetratricopeptide repeat protein n=1 Tax=Hymenobacter nivis TaxID=1850093 RepID=A0A2Z3H232_9BACT|nr:hypothetical protein [Hymenobacter nivis]AWM35060.1 hypothetical protein DDQ68_21190 [Hymenobacter nivis]
MLARTYYLFGQPQRNWSAFADAALAYGKKYASRDSHSLYDAAAQMEGFIKDDKVLLTKADQIIQQALAANRSYDNLCTLAKLLHKLGRDPEAARVAQEAVAQAAKDQKNPEEATELLAEISQKKPG